MSGQSNIEWTDATWNPIVGCSIVSPGCTNCYAMRMAARIEAALASPKYICGGARQYLGTTRKVNGNAVWTGKVALAPDDTLLTPLRWKKPRRIFVNSMGDLFHENAPDEWIDKVFAVMALCPQHTFQVLTKRAERMREYTLAPKGWPILGIGCDWPLPNIWLGVSAERQQEWDQRKDHLRNTPAAVRFASFEPLLGPIVEPQPLSDFIDWAIVGGESGPGARPMHPDWARSLRDECEAAGVPFFMKQMTKKAPIPDDLLVREWPDAA